MTVLVFEDNLIWSTRLVKAVESLGHKAVLVSALATEWPTGDVAILNLGSQEGALQWQSANLKGAGVYIIGHAGHKETELLEAGDTMGCDVVATNSTITFKLDKLLADAAAQSTLGQQ